MQAGIRITLTLTNFWPEFGGIGWYVNNTIGAGQPQELFYTDTRPITAYQTWVRARLPRVTVNFAAERSRHLHAACRASDVRL